LDLGIAKVAQLSQNDKVRYCGIDYATFEKFVARVRSYTEEKQLTEDSSEFIIIMIEELIEQIERENSKRSDKGPAINVPFLLTAVRGLVLLLTLPEMDELRYYETFERVIYYFRQCSVRLRVAQAQQSLNECEKILLGFSPSKFIALNVPTAVMSSTVVKFQNYITIVIIEDSFKQEIIQCMIEVLDLYYQGNADGDRPAGQIIPYKEFYNDALNKEVDLRKQAEIFIREWRVAQRSGLTFDKHKYFTLFNYPWSLNAYKKSELFREIYAQDRHQFIGQALIQNVGMMFNGNNNRLIDNVIGEAHFTVKISRDNILEDCLNYLVGGNANLKKPLRVIFNNEPAIDEGGVKKELFQLVFKELFKPDFGMFNYNPDLRLYWFNGYSFEPPVNFHLAGILMGLAASNQVIIDIPIMSACYKYILGQKADITDLQAWQPEVASSFKYILEYEEEEPLEEVLHRTFTIDLESYGETISRPLKVDGEKVYVTKENREEFVSLYIDCLFYQQCASQLDEFKKGFFKLFDQNILVELYNPEELEQFVCGTKILDFKTLQKVTKYIQPLSPNHQFVLWFWDIVHNLLDDTQRR